MEVYAGGMPITDVLGMRKPLSSCTTMGGCVVCGAPAITIVVGTTRMAACHFAEAEGPGLLRELFAIVFGANSSNAGVEDRSTDRV